MLKVVLCDDNDVLLSNTEAILERIFKKNNINAKVFCKAKNIEEIEVYLKHNSANVFFLDINLNSNKNGFEFALKLRETDRDSYIVFMSAHLEYVFHSFKTRPFRFIPKPVSKEALEECINEIYEDYLHKKYPSNQNVIDSITIRYASSIHKVKFNDIVYIERSSNKTTLYLSASIIQCYESLESLLEKLPAEKFFRCHRAYVINSSYIKEINFKEKTIYLENGYKCNIGRKYLKEAKNLNV